MDEAKKKELISFAADLHHAAELLETAAQGNRGWKAAGQRARVSLTEIKKKITGIKRLTMDEAQ